MTPAKSAPAAGVYTAVIGAVNMDLWGRSRAPLRQRDSNPGAVYISPGGVGRNIAHNLRLLGEAVEMLTVLGGDLWADALAASCAALGIGLERAKRVPEGRTGAYLYITGPEGDMALAVCDTDLARSITPALVEQNLDWLNRAALVVFDGNLAEETVAFLTAHCTSPLFADPVSAAKAGHLAQALGRIHTLKPNALEAEVLCGERDPARAAAALHRMGVRHVFVSAGSQGVYAAGPEGCVHVPCIPGPVVNTTGAGDAALAALCKSFLAGRTTEEAARYAMAAASLTVGSPETIAPALSDAAVRARLAASIHTTEERKSYI